MDGGGDDVRGDDPFARLGPVFAGRRALLLEDDPALSDHVAERLTAAGFEAVDRFDAGEAALEAAGRSPYDVLILDRLTAGMDGLEMLRRLRAGGGTSADAPALMLTALGGERQKVEGLLGGADDYLAKPVGDEELVARIAAQLRRASGRARPAGAELVNGPFRLSPGARTLRFEPGPGESRLVDLSPLEFAIVAELMAAQGADPGVDDVDEIVGQEFPFHPAAVPQHGLGHRLAAAMGVLAALALSGSLLVTGAAVRMDQREKAALAALDDYGAMISKLGSEASLSAERITEADAAWLSAFLSAFQNGPARDARTLEETCRTGAGGAGVRFIRAPVGKPAGLAALETARGERAGRLGEDLHPLIVSARSQSLIFRDLSAAG